MTIELWYKLKLEIDDDDYDMVSQYKWYFMISQNSVMAKIGKRNVPIARFITKPPTGMVVHHINRNPLDNRKENLIVLTPREHAKIHGKIKHLERINKNE